MRDLSGRRQRDINNERRLKDYIAGQVPKVLFVLFMQRSYSILKLLLLQAERDKEAEETKEAKLEKLRRIAAGENKAKYDFSDPDYDKVSFTFLKFEIMIFLKYDCHFLG